MQIAFLYQAFIQARQAECDQRWLKIGHAMAADRYAELDDALGLQDHGQGFETWHVWAWNFGFSGIEHDYFCMADSPQELPFTAFTPAPRDWENRLEEEFERFEVSGLWGVRWRDETTGQVRVVLAPEWESIAWATTGGVWLCRHGLFAYARLHKEGVRLAFDPQLDEVWNFFEGENLQGAHCAIVRRGEWQGILNADGSWLLTPSVDEIWGFEHSFAPFRSGEKYGFINHKGQIAIEAIFDDVSNFSPSGLAPVWENDRVGLIDTRGAIILAPEFDQVEWREDFRGFLLTHDEKVGLAKADGSLWIAPQFDELKVLMTRSQIAARQGDQWGMLDWRGEVICPPRFHEIETRYSDDIGFDDEVFSLLQHHHKQCIVRIDKHVGLIDATGQVLIPIRYDAVESLTPQTVTSDNGQPQYQHHLVYIVQRGAKRRKLRGVYDIEACRELVPCVWHHLLDCQFDDQTWGFLVGMDIPKADRERLGEARTGILTAEGKELFPPDYAWIGKAISINGDSWLTAVLRKCLYEAWSNGKPAQAVPNETGAYVWLHQDGRVEQHIDYLTNCFEQTGELEKALEIGRTYRDGIGVDIDTRLARQWLWRATGAIDHAPTPSLWKKLTSKLGGSNFDQEKTPAPQVSALLTNMAVVLRLIYLAH